MKTAAVIGGGYAGMAAAVALADAGVRVSVHESGPVLGGRARRITTQGRSLDNGQHILAGAYSELLGLMRRVGVPADAVDRRPLELVYARDFSLRAAKLPAPLDNLVGLLTARGVPLSQRAGAVGFMLRMRLAGFRLDPDRSVDALLREHGQDGAIGRYLWRPLCISALNTAADTASANGFLAVIRDTLNGGPGASHLLLPRRDLSALFPEPAGEHVESRGGEILLRSPVRSIAPDDGGVSVEGRRYDAAVLACGPHQLARFEGPLGELPSFAYEPIYTCYLQYPSGTLLPLAMLGLADGIVQWVFDRGALLGKPGQFACVISARGEHESMGHDALARRCHDELCAAVGRLPDPEWTQVVAEKRATVRCVAGRPTPGPSTTIHGLVLAGDYTDPEYPPTLEAAARSGVRAARLLLSR